MLSIHSFTIVKKIVIKIIEFIIFPFSYYIKLNIFNHTDSRTNIYFYRNFLIIFSLTYSMYILLFLLQGIKLANLIWFLELMSNPCLIKLFIIFRVSNMRTVCLGLVLLVSVASAQLSLRR